MVYKERDWALEVQRVFGFHLFAEVAYMQHDQRQCNIWNYHHIQTYVSFTLRGELSCHGAIAMTFDCMAG